MIDLTKLPIFENDASRNFVHDACFAEGRTARRCGIPLSECPPFRVSDMAIDWCNGWRLEDEDIARKRSGPA
jgi:hypothetical protein